MRILEMSIQVDTMYVKFSAVIHLMYIDVHVAGISLFVGAASKTCVKVIPPNVSLGINVE